MRDVRGWRIYDRAYERVVADGRYEFYIRAKSPGSFRHRHEEHLKPFWTGFLICSNRKSGAEVLRVGQHRGEQVIGDTRTKLEAALIRIAKQKVRATEELVA